MYPIIAQFGPVTIFSYGLMIAIAFLIGVFLAKKEVSRKGLNPDLIYDFALYLVVAALIGARLYYLAFFDPTSFIRNPIAIFKVWQGGLALHGALLGGIIGGLVFSRLRKISFWKLADIAVPSLFLGQAIGRIGCFLNGCCYGVPTESIFGVRFPQGSAAYIAYQGLAVHPTQLYESFLNLIGFFILWGMRKRVKIEGALFLLYLMLYNSMRVVVSSLRGDSLFIWGTNIKIAQVISGALFLIALTVYTKKIKR